MLMRSLLLLLAVTSSSLVAVVDSQTPGPGQALDADGNLCWNNLTALDEVETATILESGFSVFRSYVLCPDTTFGIALFEDGEFVDGQTPLFALANSEIKCGVDGKSYNNCRMRGGSVHVLLVFETVNATISGITFESSFINTLFFSAPGQVAFHDCIVQNNANNGPIVASLPDGRRRRMTEIGSNFDGEFHESVEKLRSRKSIDLGVVDANDRWLQETDGNSTNSTDMDMDMDMNITDPDTDPDTNITDPPTMPPDAGPTQQRLDVTFTRCTFRKNDFFGETLPGLVFILSRNIFFSWDQCIFEDNIAPSTDNFFGSLILSFDKVNVTNSCFLRNQVSDAEIVVLAPFANDIVDFNNYFESDPPTDCQVASLNEATGVFSCRDSIDLAQECQVVPETEMPSAAPMPAPVAAPVELPGSGEGSESGSGGAISTGILISVGLAVILSMGLM